MATTKRRSPGNNAQGPATTGKADHTRTRRTLNITPRATAIAVSAAFMPWIWQPVFADPAPNQLPTGGQVGAGSVTISTSGTKMDVNQTTNSAIINWGCFCVGVNGWVNFNQPGASSVTLNRSTAGIEIFGRVTAPGSLFFTSSAGAYVGRTGSVNAGSAVFSNLTISDKDFLAGRYIFSNDGTSSGSVTNDGTIVALSGYAALAGTQVRNNGVIVAQAGTVALAAGDRISIDMIGDGLVKVSVDAAALNALALNSGTLQADGGRVVLTARSANALLDTVINNTGVIRATTLVERKGEIVLDGGDKGIVSNSGTVTATGLQAGQQGGNITIVGQYVALNNGTRIDASGDAGGGTVLVGGNFQGQGPLQNASQTIVDRDVSIKADAITAGDGGQVVIWSNDATQFYGSISAQGGSQSGNGGNVEVSGKHGLHYVGTTNTSAPNGHVGTLLLDPDDLTIAHAVGTAVDINNGTGPAFVAADNSIAWQLLDSTINLSLATTDVTVTTSTGSITANSDVAITMGTSNLSLNSATSLILGGTYTSTTGQLNLNYTTTLDLHTNTYSVGGVAAVMANGGGAGTIEGPNQSTAWSLAGTAGTLVSTSGTIAFSGVSTLQGGTGIDTFTLGGAATFALNGGAGVDVFALGGNTLTGAIDGGANGGSITGIGSASLTAPGTTTGFSGTTALVSGNFTNVTDLQSTGGTLQGTDAASAWAITGTAGTYTSTNALTFSGFGTLQGGTGIDTFTLGGAATFALNGGAGVDVFALGGNTLTGAIDGGANGGSITGIGSASLTAPGTTTGFSGTTALVTGNFTNVTDLQSTGGTLQGTDAAGSWAITGTAGTYTSTNALTFSGFGTLQGGTGIDTFTLGGAATFALNGGAGVDVFALGGNTLTGAIDGQANGGSITGIGSASLTAPGTTTGFSGTTALVSGNFTNITDLQSTGGTLQGTDAASAWAITGTAGTYTSTNALTFSGFGTLQGGTGIDTFTLGGASTFNLAGGAGLDVFALAGNTLTGSIAGEANGGSITGIGSASLTATGATTGFNGTSANVTGNFTDITNLSGTGTLQGLDAASAWAITGTAGTYTSTNALTFSGFGTLQGGTGIDTFTLGGASSFGLAGGAGVDVFALAGNTLTGAIDGGANGGSITGIGSASLTAPGTTTGFSGTTALVTGNFTNVTDLQSTGGTLQGTDAAGSWAITGTAGTYTSTNALTFSGFGTLQGGTGIDTFTLGGAATFALNGGAGVDVFALGGNTLTGAIDGQANGGSITGIGSASLTAPGTTTGFSGTTALVSGNFTNITDLQSTGGTLQGTDAASAWAITGTAGTYTSTNALTFSGFGTLQGGTGIDTFTLGGASTFNLAGGAGLDVFALAGNTLTGSIAGEANGGSITGIGSASLTATGATTGFNGTSANVTGNFTDITNLSGTGTLQGLDAASAWAITGTAGTYTSTNALTFSGFGTLQGGTGIDTFTLGGASTFNLAGGAGLDVFALAGNTLTGSIAGEANGGSITGIGSASLTATGATTGFNGTSANVTGNFTDITNLSGTGTLQGTDAAGSWAITGTAGTYTSTNALTFSGFGTLQGGTGIDTFTLGGASSFGLAGGAGVDVFALAGNTLTGAIDGGANGGSITGIGSASLTAPGTTTGFSGTTALVTGNFTNVTDLQSTGGTLQGTDAAGSWAITGTAGTYTSTNALTFSGFGTLQGGTGIDTFTLGGAATFALNGGAGVDVFALGGNTLTGAIDGQANGGSITGIGSASLTAPGTTTGFSGTTALVSGNFTNITDLQSTGGTLQGTDAASAWAITGTAGTYTSTNALTFSGFGTLQGGTGIDTFTLGGASTFNLAGGAGLDVFALAGNTLTGSIAGEANGGSITGIGSASLTATGATTGFNGTSANVTGNFTDITNLSGTGTLQGLDAASAWAITGTAGTYTSTNALTFSGFGTLQGGTGIDTFTLGGASTFNLAGGAGLDVFALGGNTLTGAIDGQANGGSITGIGSASLTAPGTTTGFSGTTALVTGNFTNITDLQSTGGTLQGTDAASAWAITGTAGTYTSTNALTFSGFGTLQGGTGIDTFTLGGASSFGLAGGAGVDVFALAGNTLTGAIDGGANGGSITGIGSASLTAPGTTTGFSGTTALVTGNFTNITDLQSTGGTLQGTDAAGSWAIAGTAGAGTYTSTNALTFSGFGTLQGGTGIDTFTLGGAATFALNGGAGVDVFALGGNTLTGAIDGQANGGSITGIGSASLTAPGTTTGFSGTTALVSGNFTNITNLSGTGTLLGLDAASAWAITGTAGTYTSTNALTFSGFGTLQGGTGIDTFTLGGASTFNLAGGAGLDVFALAGNTLTGSIAGEANGGSITGIGSASLTATGATTGFNGTSANVTGNFTDITNLSGTGTLQGLDAASAWAITGTAGTYTSTNALTFSGFGTLQGGTGIDTFTLGGASSFGLAGGAGVDVFALAGNTLTGAIDGGANGGSITGIGSASLTAPGTTTGFSGTTALVTGNFTNITDLQSTGGTLQGTDAAGSWAIAGTAGAGTYTSTNALTFSGFGTLQGGTGIDTFTLGGAATFALNGGAGVDVFALGGNTLTGAIDGQANGGSITGIGSASLTAPGTTTGFSGTTALVSGNFTNITDLQSTGGTLQGTDAASAWAITGTAGTYTSTNALTFSGFGTLQGGTGIDTFTLGGASTFNLAGGAGLDVFALAGNTLTGSIAGEANGGSITGIGSASLTATGATTGFNGTSANVTGNFTDITNLAGTGTLQGLDAASAWAITGTAGTYTSTNALTFSGFGTLQGGTGIDTFTLGGASTFNLAGGAGLDVFALAGNTLTGSIAGEANGGSITGIGSASLTATGATTGFNGTSANVTGNFTDITNLSGTGTLQGTDAAGSWAITGTAGTYTSTNALTFSGFGTLQGGTGIDTFTLGGASSFGLAGGAGVDVFALAGNTLTGAIDGGANGGSITGIGSASLTAPGTTTGFSGTTALVTGNFTNVTDLQSTGGTLQGTDAAGSWAITGTAGTYTSTNALTFSGFGTLQGGTGIDTFTLGGAATFALNGGAGVDVFALGGNTLTGAIDGQANGGSITGIGSASLTAPGTTTGFSGTTALVSGNFTNITNLSGTGTLLGLDAASAWAITGTAGTYTSTNALTFSGFGTLQGGTGIDTFTLGGASTFNLAGGAGLDVFALAGNTLTGSIAGEANGGSITGIGSASLTATAATTGFNGTSANVTGNFTDITNLSGTGTLQGLDAASAWAITGTAGTYTSTNALTFSGFGTLQGGTGIDTFTLGGASTFNLAGGAGADVFVMNALLTGSVDGQGGSDTLQGTQVGSVTLTGSTGNGYSGTGGGATGFAGIDVITSTGGTLTGDGNASTWTLGGAQTYSDGGPTLTFSGFSTLQGGGGADTFNVNVATSATLLGGGAVDQFNINATLTGTANGEAGGATLAGTNLQNVTLTGIGGLAGFDGTTNATALTGGFSNMTGFTGNNTGTLTGLNAASNWAGSGSNAGTYTSGVTSATFAGFPSWTAGSNTDAFATVSITGNLVDGGGATALTGAINSSGSQTYTGAITLTSAMNVTAGGSVSFVSVTGATFSVDITAGGTITPGTMNVGSGQLHLTAGSTINGGTVTGTSALQNVLSAGGSSTLNVDFQGVPLVLTGAASTWNLSGPATAPVFGVTNPATNIFYNGSPVGGAAVVAIQQSGSVIGSTLAEIARAALLEAQDTDSVQKQIAYGFVGDVGTTPPMDHRIDETGISVPACFNDSREGQTCR